MDPNIQSWIIHTTKELATFAKENYEPWNDMHEDDIAMYLIESVKEGTILTVDVGGELVAFYEYWPITPSYLRRIRNMKSNDEWPLNIPSNGDRSGDGSIILFPLGVVAKAWMSEILPATRMCVKKLRKKYPDLKGHWRWVLKEERVKWIKYKDKEE